MERRKRATKNRLFIRISNDYLTTNRAKRLVIRACETFGRRFRGLDQRPRAS